MSIKTAIIGASGFTGSELVRILHHHPQVDIEAITSESHAGRQFSDIHPQLFGLADYELVPGAEVNADDFDLIYLALPHGVSMDFVEKLHGKRARIIDLSGDFRLSTPETYESWYGKNHTFRQGFEEAVYGLPELHREAVKESRLVANPGCYPTSVILATLPLIKGGLADPKTIIADSKSGVTGAGIKPKPLTHFSNINDNFMAYGLKRHRHTVEIEEQLAQAGGPDTVVQFTPHLLPVDRGILSTVYAQPHVEMTEEMVRNAFELQYAEEPFVRLRDHPPTIKDVRATNYCDIFPTFDDRTRRIIVIAAIDNLVKGAAGQAVHNMNLQFGWEECTGLEHLPIRP